MCAYAANEQQKAKVIMHIKTKWIDCECNVVTRRSRNGIDIRLSSPEGPIATASVCRPARRGHTWLKGWSENEGLPEALEAAGVVRLTGETAPAGYAHVQEAEVLM